MTTDISSTARAYTLGQFFLIALFAVVFFADPSAVMAMPRAVAWAGLALCAIGLAGGATALLAMGRVMQVSPEPKAEGHLVTRGIYRYLRHPMYTAIMLVALGLWLRKPTLFIGLAALALYALLFAKARFEEALLEARYPDYAEYRRHTWGVIPGTGRRH